LFFSFSLSSLGSFQIFSVHGAGASPQQLLAVPVVGTVLAGTVGILVPNKVVTGTLDSGDEGYAIIGVLGFSQKIRVYFHRFCELVVSVAFLVKSIPYFKGSSVKVNDLEQVTLPGR
jgi:hypothetical protein